MTISFFFIFGWKSVFRFNTEKNSINCLRRCQVQKFDDLDSLIYTTKKLPLLVSKNQNGQYEMPSPVMFEFSNPLARFSCLPGNRDWVAKSAAETLYAFSGMNGNDFIWEFRGWEDPSIKKQFGRTEIGPSLRFLNRKGPEFLGYSETNNLRQSGTGFIDQLSDIINIFNKNKEDKKVILQLYTKENPCSIYQAWIYCRENKLNIMLWAGYLDHFELVFKYIPIFSFLLQILSDLTNIEMGGVQVTIGCLLIEKEAVKPPPIIKIGDFRYPSGNLTLRDLDVLMSIMVEFVVRLDEKSLNRANPFERDDRVLIWQDYAEIFRAWKAEKLGYKIDMEQVFHHPQLRFIYKGETI